MKGAGVESTDLGGEPLSLRSDAWALRARVKRPCLAWETGPLRNILGATSNSAFPAPGWPVLPTAVSSASEADDKSWSDVTQQPLKAVHKGLRIKRVSAQRLHSVYTCTESRKFLLQAFKEINIYIYLRFGAGC